MCFLSKLVLVVTAVLSLVTSVHCQVDDSIPTNLPPADRAFRLGCVYYRAEKYDDAIVFFQKALDLHTANPSLSPTYWHVLIDCLGMSHGMTGNLNKAEEIFRYGISKDSCYPLFYYNLACAFAEKENLDSTIAFLKSALAFKANMLEGELFPDPTTDGSFQRFMSEESFTNLLSQYEQVYTSVDSIAKPNYGDTVRVDINCDGIGDYAVGVKRDSVYELAVILGPEYDSATRSVIKLSIGLPAFSQSDICGDDAKLEMEELYATLEEMMNDLDYVPQGYIPSERCKGLVIFAVDGECDSFHCFWNHETSHLDWWRL